MKLASYFVVTNTYLNVFTMLGIMGLIIGVAGLGLILIRNFEQRRSEFALMMATGFSISKIKYYILADQMIILIWGIITGTLSALFATLPVLQNTGKFSPDKVIMMILLIFFTGAIILLLSFKKVRKGNIISGLRRE